MAPPEAVAAAALGRAPIFDGHNDLAIHFAGEEPMWTLGRIDLARLQGQTNLDKWRQARVGGALITTSSALPAEAANHFPALQRSFDWFDSIATRHSGAVQKAESLGDIRAAKSRRRIALMIAVEGGHQIDGSIANLRAAYARGLRSMGIIYNDHNAIGDGAMPPAVPSRPAAGGLTPFGRQLIAEMNRLGMIVDLSHSAQSSAEQAILASRAPVIFSHSGARTVTSSPRNLTDQTLRLAARHGAVVMVPVVPYLVSEDYWRWWSEGEANYARLEKLYPADPSRIASESRRWDSENPPPPVGIDDVADHIDHVARVAGFAHVGIGSDFDGMGSHVIPTLSDTSKLPALFAELARRGWTQAQLEALASGNFERVLDQVEKAAVR